MPNRYCCMRGPDYDIVISRRTVRQAYCMNKTSCGALAPITKHLASDEKLLGLFIVRKILKIAKYTLM